MLVGGLLAGCQSDSLRPEPIKEPSDLYWALDLNHHAVTMSTVAPYDTLRLTAVPRNYHGEALATSATPIYSSSDQTLVSVTPDGLLTARKPTTDFGVVTITATLTTGNLLHEDKVMVEVVDTAPSQKLASFSIHPVPPDSAKTASSGVFGLDNTVGLLYQLFTGQFNPIAVRAVDSNDVAMSHFLVSYRSSNAAVVSAGNILGFDNPPRDSVLLLGQNPGTTTLYASATVFGIAKADTLTVRVGWPLLASVTTLGAAQGGGFDASEIHVGPGGAVMWHTDPLSGDTADIVFANATNVLPAVDPTADSLSSPLYFPLCTPFSPIVGVLVLNNGAVSSANALDCTGQGGSFTLAPNPTPEVHPGRTVYPPGVASRRFPVPGTYEYTNTRTGARGRIVVGDD